MPFVTKKVKKKLSKVKITESTKEISTFKEIHKSIKVPRRLEEKIRSNSSSHWTNLLKKRTLKLNALNLPIEDSTIDFNLQDDQKKQEQKEYTSQTSKLETREKLAIAYQTTDLSSENYRQLKSDQNIAGQSPNQTPQERYQPPQNPEFTTNQAREIYATKAASQKPKKRYAWE